MRVCSVLFSYSTKQRPFFFLRFNVKTNKCMCHQMTKRKVSMASVPLMMKANMAFRRCSEDNYFLTFWSQQHVLRLYSEFKILQPSPRQSVTSLRQSGTHVNSPQITHSHTDIKSFCSCFWCFLEFSGRPCWPEILLPNWL